MGVALELLRFSSRRAEVRYQLQLSHRLASADANAYFAHASLLFGGMMIIGLREGVLLRAFLHGLTGVLVCLPPLLIHRRDPAGYRRHRRMIVAAHRLGCLLIPAPAFTFRHLPVSRALGPSWANFISVMSFCSQLITYPAMALALRLDFDLHLALQLLLSSRVLVGIADTCSAPFLNNPATLRRFQSVAAKLSALSSEVLLFGSELGLEDGGGGAAPEPAVHHCVAVAAFTHILLGLLIPAVAVYLADRRYRAEFLAGEAAQAGPGVGPIEAGKRLGLHLREAALASVHAHGSRAWVPLAAVAPLVAALLWTLVLAAAARLVP